MKRTPLYLLIAACLLQVVTAMANYFTAWTPGTKTAGIALAVGLWLKENGRFIVFCTAALAALVTLIKDLPRMIGYRSSKASDKLDQFADSQWPDGGGANSNRVTLFRVVPGWRAFLTGLWRLRWRIWRRAHKLRALKRIEWGADYLQVYARSSDSRTRRSSACFRTADKEEETEGVVGRVWLQRWCKEPDLPKLEAASLRNIKNVTTLPPKDPRREYAERINIRDPRLLQAMDTYSTHYLGSTVLVGGKKWGVLLLDSSDVICPFSGTKKKAQLEKDFRRLAKELSHFLD